MFRCVLLLKFAPHIADVLARKLYLASETLTCATVLSIPSVSYVTNG